LSLALLYHFKMVCDGNQIHDFGPFGGLAGSAKCALCLCLFTAESGFAASLYDLSRNVVHEFVVLSRHCLEGGQAALETLLQERLVSTPVSN